jgi:hypothetical protein
VTALERTAYPRFKRRPSAKELAEVYTPTAEDLAFVRGIARGAAPTLTAMVLLTSFKRLGYMPRLQDVPFAIIGHVRACLRLPSETSLEVTPRTLYRHHQSIRDYLQVRGWDREARHDAVEAAYRAAQVMNHPADLINVAIEELVRQRSNCPRSVRSTSSPGTFALSSTAPSSTPYWCSYPTNSVGSWTSFWRSTSSVEVHSTL